MKDRIKEDIEYLFSKINWTDNIFDKRLKHIKDNLIADIDKELSLHQAEQQLYGWSLRDNDNRITELVSSMGLTLEEWDALVTIFEVDNYLSERAMTEIENYLLQTKDLV